MKRLLLVVCFVLLSATTANAIRLVSIAGERVNMRSGPGENHAVLWELGLGYPLKVIGTKGEWYKVADFEGDVGWVYSKMVDRKPHLIVKKPVINIRSGPGSNYKVVGKANYGVVFTTVQNNGKGWVKVKHENGLSGWVKRTLLWGW